MSTKKSMNPISLRSRKCIIEALLELMEQKPYHKISIKEITERADFVRKTFYRNFQSKDEILFDHINGLMKEIEPKLEKEEGLTPYILAKIYFEFWQNHIHFLKLLQKNDLFVILLKQLDDYWPSIIRKYKGDIIACYDITYLPYYTVFISAGIWHILEAWIGRGAIESPEKMARIYSDLLLNNPQLKPV